MFTEFLQRHPMPELLRSGTRALYPPAEDRAAWDRILPEYREEIRRLAETYARESWPVRSASGFLAFTRTGNRQADERPYFARRRKLCAAVLNCCAFPETEIDDVADGIWLLCEESAWVISAHNVNPVPGAPAPAEYPLPDVRKPYIDLFSAQTGMILSLTSSLLGKRLDSISPLLRERIREEIRRRILRPFMATDDFWWMGFRRKDLNNWTPWILSNIIVCALLDCLDVLEKATGGRMAFWKEDRIRNILRFPLAVEMGGGWFANFADCDARPFISGERLETAGEKLADLELTALGARMRGTVADQLNDTPHLTRALDLLFRRPPAVPAQPEACVADSWLPDLQVRLVRRGRWTLVCKGGHNGENHNHNDVGSFILAEGGEPVVVDAGNMIYTAKTFSKDRYSLWNVRAEWHNLPVVGGEAQREGAEHAARNVVCTPEGMALDLEAAYSEAAGIRYLRRTFSLGTDGLRLTDEGDLLSPREIAWIFLLRHQPAWEPGRITAGNLLIRCPEGLTFLAEEKPVTDARMARSWPGSLWRVSLKCEAGEHFHTDFVFTAKER